MKNNWLYIALIAILVVVTLQLWDSPPDLLTPEDDAAAERRNFPYAILDNAHSRHFDEQGQLSYEFLADKLRHFRLEPEQISPNDYTLMDALTVTLHTDDSQWFVSADQGKLTDAGNTLTLQSNVRIWQPQENGDVTELTTTTLVIYPRDKIVSTEADVKLTAPEGKLEATGMVVDLNTRNIKLLNNVRGYHEPI